MTNRWYTTKEVADLLGITSESVRRLIYDRRLAATVITGGSRPTFRISAEALAAFRRTYVRDTMHEDWE